MAQRLAESSVAIVRSRPVSVVALLALPVMIIDQLWVLQHRSLGLFDADEAGYLANSLRMQRAFADGGVMAVLDVLPDRTAPLVPVLSALSMGLGSRSIAWAMAVQPLLHGLTAVAVTGIARRVASGAVPFVCGVMVLGMPASLIQARTYHFAGASAAFLCLAVWALLASDRGRRPWPVVGLTVSLAAMVLSRTMMLAFLPVVAVAVAVVVGRDRRGWRNMVLAAVGVAALAGPWWIFAWGSAGSYLVSYGYGSDSARYGPEFFFGRVMFRVARFIGGFRVLLGVPVVVTWVLAARPLWNGRRRAGAPGGWSERERALVAVWSVAVLGTVVLVSTPNLGIWFDHPTLVMAVAGTGGLLPLLTGRVRRRLMSVMVAAAVVNVALVGWLPITWNTPLDSRDDTARISFMFFAGPEITEEPFIEADPRLAPIRRSERAAAVDEWWAANVAVVDAVAEEDSRVGGVTQTLAGSTNLINGNSILLAQELALGTNPPLDEVVTASPTADLSEATAISRRDRPNLLLIVRGRSHIFEESRSQEALVTAAEAAGFEPRHRVALPDGGEVLLMGHPDVFPPS